MEQMQRTRILFFNNDISWSSTDVDPVEISCPHCKNVFEFGAWTLVNARESPEAVPKIIDGTIFAFSCPKCGYEAHLAHPCLFIDPERQICIYSVIDSTMAKQAEDMFNDPENEAASASICRITFDRKDLAEKVLTLCCNLDDRAIELLKFGIRGSAKMQGLANANDNTATRLEAIRDNGNLMFGIECGSKRFTTDMDFAAYELFADALSKSSISGEQPLYVDPSWGVRALDIIEAEGVMP